MNDVKGYSKSLVGHICHLLLVVYEILPHFQRT